jgi:hypothetical protein
MRKLMIFGKNYSIVEQNSGKDELWIKNSKIFVGSHEKSVDSLVKEFLAQLLDAELLKTYERMKSKGKVDLFGDIDFEVVEKIDNKKQRIAKLKGNKILVKMNAVALPKKVLKYIIAHEIAHIVTKRHTKKFWKIVETICPSFERGQDAVEKYRKFLCNPLTARRTGSFSR